MAYQPKWYDYKHEHESQEDEDCLADEARPRPFKVKLERRYTKPRGRCRLEVADEHSDQLLSQEWAEKCKQTVRGWRFEEDPSRNLKATELEQHRCCQRTLS